MEILRIPSSELVKPYVAVTSSHAAKSASGIGSKENHIPLGSAEDDGLEMIV